MHLAKSAPVHSLLCYRLANYLLSLETDSPILAVEAERILRQAGVVRATYRKHGRVYEYTLRLSAEAGGPSALTYCSSNQKDAWAGAVGLLHQHVVDRFQAGVAS